MNIGIVLDNDLNSDNRVLREAEIMKCAGHKIFVLCFGFSPKNYKPVDGITISRIWITKRVKDVLFFLLNIFPAYEWMWSSAINKFITINKIDIIHTHDLYMAKCTRAGIKKSGSRIRMILDLHENFAWSVTTYNWTKGFLRNLLSRPSSWAKKEERYLQCADGIVVLSKEYEDKLTERYASLKEKLFCILPNVPDVAKMNSLSADPASIPFRKQAPLMFYYGIIAERRGIFDALTVLGEVISEGHKIEFLIIGPTDKKDRSRFEQAILSPALQGMVTYIQWIDHSLLPAYLAASDFCIAPFLINPQHESGVANKIYEYMYGSKPVIASACKPQKSLIEKHQCGIVYNDNAGLRSAIITLLNDRDLREKMGKNGNTAVLTYYNTEVIGKNLADLYDTLNK
jgi:glycosyltransferase involved in cell wall biosynthesis